MRLRSYLLGLSVIASSFIAVNPVEAQSRNGWYKAGCYEEGNCIYVKKLGGSWPIIKFQIESPSGMFTNEADCEQLRYRILNPTRPWNDFMSGQICETIFETICR